MSSFEQHCQQSVATFAKEFAEVHRWLDEFAGTPEYGMRHRKLRHHTAGLEEVQKLFGEEGVAAARQHIIADLKLEGWKDGDPFPKDERDYVKMGLF